MEDVTKSNWMHKAGEERNWFRPTCASTPGFNYGRELGQERQPAIAFKGIASAMTHCVDRRKKHHYSVFSFNFTLFILRPVLFILFIV